MKLPRKGIEIGDLYPVELDEAEEMFERWLFGILERAAARAIDLRQIAGNLIDSGMTPREAESFLINDLLTEGRIFKDFFVSIRDQVGAGAETAINDAAEMTYRNNKYVLGYDREDDIFEEWISVLDDGRCEDCIDRHADIKPHSEWVQEGVPRAGATRCMDRCRCMLIMVPKEAEEVPEKYREAVGQPIVKSRPQRAAKIIREPKEK